MISSAMQVDADEMRGRRHQDGRRRAGGDGLGQSDLHLLLVKVAGLEVLLEQRVVGFCGGLHDASAVFLDQGRELVGDRTVDPFGFVWS